MNDRLQFNESLEIRLTQEELRDVVRWVRALQPTNMEEFMLREMNSVLYGRAIDSCNQLYDKLAAQLGSPYLNPPWYVQEGFCYNASDSIIFRCSLDEHHVAEVKIRLASDWKAVRLEVEDNGTGIEPDVEHNLFGQKISSQKKGKAIFVGGWGTHMHDARVDIEKLQGKLGYVNKGHEKGAIFWYEVPLAATIPAGVEVSK